MRLPSFFSGSWNWTPRGLIYVISWLGPSTVLPTPIAQFVFPFQQAARAVSMLEIGAKIAKEGIINFPFPPVMSKQQRKFHYKMNRRLQQGVFTVKLNEIIEAGLIHFETLQNSSVTMLPNGNVQFTIVTGLPDPRESIARTYHRQRYGQTVHMQVVDYPETGVQISQTFEISALDWQHFCISLANDAHERIGIRLLNQEFIGITPTEFSKWFPEDRDPDSGTGSGSAPLVNYLVICDEKKFDFLKNQKYKPNIAVDSSIAVDPDLPFVGKISSPIQIFVTYIIIAAPLTFFMSKLIQKLLEKFKK